MTILANPKHERFAQELASGKSSEESYVTAGYKPNRGNAGVLRHKQYILMRVSEILAQRESIHAQATTDAIKSAGLTKAWVIETLTTNLRMAMERQNYQGGVANRALELLGKELGMFIDRKDVTIRKDVKELSDHELADILAGSRKGNGSTEIDPSLVN